MSHSLYRLGRWAASRPWSMLAIWLAVSVTVIGASAGFGRQLEDSFGAPGLDSQEAIDLLSSAGFDESGLTAQVVATPTDDGATFFDSAAATDELATLHGALAGLENVLATTDPAAALAAGPEAAVASGTVSPDGQVALIRLQYPRMEELSIDDLDRLKDALAEAGEGSSAVRIEAGGDLFFSFEEAESGLGEMMGLVAAVVVLLVAFGSLLAMGLPIGIALFGVALGSSVMLLVNHLIDIPSWTPQIAAMVGIGVGIDYALFLVVRHREHLAAGHSVPDAAGLAVATAGQAVIFAGGTVVIAILGLAVAGIPFVTAAGVGISIMVGIMVLGAVTLLPALLGLFGHRINGLRSSKRTVENASAASAVTPRWERWGTHVSKHAWLYAVGVTALLLAATSPVLGLRLGFPDQGTQPESRTERRAYDLVAEGFGPGINGPLVIATDVSSDPSLLEPLASAIQADPGVAAVAPPVVDDATGVAMLIAFPTTAPQDDGTWETIQRIRADVFPEVLGADVNALIGDDGVADGGAGDGDDTAGLRAHVGGQTAVFADLGEQAGERMPYFIGAVLILSIVLLTMVFRSVVVPIKAAVLNLLSIGASYGVLVMVFQWGWGKELIGLETTVPIVSFIPMFMFAILFGLSMDYEVFLLSRVREEYQATGDNDVSVIRGLAGTGRVITSAALIMISVFAGFVISDDPINKMFGLGLAVAIAVDASIVRMVLVPASMKLMGDANWWLPAWLDRVLPEIDIEGGDLASVADRRAPLEFDVSGAVGGDGGKPTDAADTVRSWEQRVPEVTGRR